ncbi:hypothetical protein AUJ46_04430 [Candidatus Peregrinibacteria bacterium CG1_02_54_53]|nr:MAG: hypothetical protein AUJ46_04430 [Candidatus Peregrinibacteria bacterium CG1_02_54_53]
MTVTASFARNNLFKLIEKAEKPGASVQITLESIPRVVMMSVEEFEGWQETLEIMSDPALLKSIEQGLRDKKSKRTASLASLKRRLKI